MRRGKRYRGSVLLMVIGLLTVIAMLGSMLLLVARLDKQTTQALATLAPEEYVAQGILDRVVADRVADLHIDPNTNVLYGKLDGNALVAERQMIDYPLEDPYGDQALACIEPNASGVWRHISHLPGTTLYRDPNNLGDPNASENISTTWSTSNQVVDTDGDGVGDSLLFPTGILDRDGGTFWAAVRMIDASGLLNVNVANATRSATPGQIMNPSDVALGALPGIPSVPLVNDRTTDGAFDMGDMLAMSWRSDPTKEPNTATGRFAGATAPNFLALRGTLTILSAANGTVNPVWTHKDMGNQHLKVDPNAVSSNPKAVYDTFYALLQANDPNVSDPSAHRARAAQLTVNLLDYLDNDPNGDPTQIDANQWDPNIPVGANYFYGIERHPFISKVFLKRIWEDPNFPEPAPICALELVNPYRDPIAMDRYTVDGTIPLQGTIQGQGVNNRFVISSGGVNFEPNLPADSRFLDSGLDTRKNVKIMWKKPLSTWSICVDESAAIDPNECPIPEPNDPNKQRHWRTTFRDDRLDRATTACMITPRTTPMGTIRPTTTRIPTGLRWGRVILLS